MSPVRFNKGETTAPKQTPNPSASLENGARMTAGHRRHPAGRRDRLYDIRGLGRQARGSRTFDDLVFLRRVAVALSAGRLSREVRHRRPCSATRYAKKPIDLEIPITIAGMSFGALSANAKEALGRAASEVGTSTTTGDGGMTPEERRSVEDARLSVPALPLRLQPGRSAQGGRHRDRHRPGRQARRRRHAAGAEDQPPASPDAHPPRRHRPALRLPPSRLDRTG